MGKNSKGTYMERISIVACKCNIFHLWGHEIVEKLDKIRGVNDPGVVRSV
jgi:hypothetical protein